MKFLSSHLTILLESDTKRGCRTILNFAGNYYFHVSENTKALQMLKNKQKTFGDVTGKKIFNLYHISFATQATN